MKLFNNILSWFKDLYLVWRREFYLVCTDAGVLVFFIFLPILYPVIYTVIYNPEVVVNLPVVVVDNSRTARSRDFARMVNATPTIDIIGYAATLDEAREAMNEHDAFGIMEIPHDFDKKLGRDEQATIPFYFDMSLLLRYRQMLSALTDIQIAYGAKFQAEKISEIGLLAQPVEVQGTPVNNSAMFLGDPTQGFASFIIPGIVVLILQQSLILGITMLAGGSAERRRRNGGFDPMQVDAPPTATLLGKALCYITIYIPMVFFLFHFVPEMFALPHYGSPMQYLPFILPMVIGAIFLGIIAGTMVTERESSLMVVVFTSVVFLFLSGLTWPRYAMSPFWRAVGNLVPATWGVEGFIRINSNNGTLEQQSTPYTALWILAAAYFVISYMIIRYRRARNRRLSPAPTVQRTNR